MNQEKHLQSEKNKKKQSNEFELVLHNDDVNTFDYVIDTLMDVCDHELYQAEQCALITHLKGKCTVRTGKLDVIKPMQKRIIERKLTASVE